MHNQGKLSLKCSKHNTLGQKEEKLLLFVIYLAFDFTEAHVLFWLGSRQMVSQ